MYVAYFILVFILFPVTDLKKKMFLVYIITLGVISNDILQPERTLKMS